MRGEDVKGGWRLEKDRGFLKYKKQHTFKKNSYHSFGFLDLTCRFTFIMACGVIINTMSNLESTVKSTF